MPSLLPIPLSQTGEYNILLEGLNCVFSVCRFSCSDDDDKTQTLF